MERRWWRGLPGALCERGKYDGYLPEPLLREAFVADHLDVVGARQRFAETMAERFLVALRLTSGSCALSDTHGDELYLERRAAIL